MDTIVPKQAGFNGKTFHASRGVRQGDIIYPTIFNIAPDAVIQKCEECFQNKYGQFQIDVLFYADDGLIGGEHAKEFQYLLDLICSWWPKNECRKN
jgi:Reverse transcriptase (RNA-dependent DNA polymerase)